MSTYTVIVSLTQLMLTHITTTHHINHIYTYCILISYPQQYIRTYSRTYRAVHTEQYIHSYIQRAVEQYIKSSTYSRTYTNYAALYSIHHGRWNTSTCSSCLINMYGADEGCSIPNT